MNANLIDEGLISMREAAKLMPRRHGVPVAGATVWRWCRFGYRGVKLEHRKTPGGFATSKAAVERFFAALEAKAAADDRQLEELGQQLQSASARELDRLGIGTRRGSLQ